MPPAVPPCLCPTDCHWIDALARAHARRLCAVARREGLAPDDALDAVQDGMMALLARPDVTALAERPEEAARLLAAMVRSAARNLRRRHHRSRPHVPAETAELVAAGDDPQAHATHADLTAQLAGCVAQLGATQQQIVRLRLLEELSGEEAAGALGLRPGHVAVLLHRARAQLSRCLADASAEPPAATAR